MNTINKLYRRYLKQAHIESANLNPIGGLMNGVFHLAYAYLIGLAVFLIATLVLLDTQIIERMTEEGIFTYVSNAGVNKYFGLGFLIPLISPIYRNVIKIYFRRRFSYEELIYLPTELLHKKKWRKTIRAIENGSEWYHETYNTTFNKLLYNLFYTSNYGMELDIPIIHSIEDFFVYSSRREWFDNHRIIDMENTKLWNKYISQNKLSERISLLESMNTSIEKEALSNRRDEDLEKFVKPFIEFNNYVEKVRNNKEFRHSELKKVGIVSHQEVVDSLKDKNRETVNQKIDEIVN